MGKKIFILDDSLPFAKLLSYMIKIKLNMHSIIAYSFQEARQLLAKEKDNIFAAILDLNLPDSLGIEHIDYCINEQIPTVVLTGDYNDDIREKIFTNKKIVDYALKTRKEDMDYVLSLLSRLQKNRDFKIIVADDSALYRKLTADLLETHLFQVFTAKNGFECIEILQRHPDVKMIVTDYDMPGMDGFTLTSLIRETYPREELSNIGVSSNETKNISSRFIKFGVNDFIGKPFSKEEFFCRINMNIDILESFQNIKDLANKDFLTKIYNRRYYFEEAGKYFQRVNQNIIIAILDIDHFKNINDSYGHDVGDKTLIEFATLFTNFAASKSLIARIGGEEFSILSIDFKEEEVSNYFENLRELISNIKVYINEKESFSFTVSIGVCITNTSKNKLNQALKIADSCLYKAKAEGRNKVIISSDL
jgi:diguanylate cyclase (GGDEF)-like protein